MEIIELSDRPELIEEGIQYFWKQWGNDSNEAFYADCIRNSLNDRDSIPKFYLALEGNKIVGSYALITNDLISRQDLIPWFACLLVEPSHRNKGIAGKLLDHASEQAKTLGYVRLYLSTDLEGFYEAKGWNYMTKGFNFNGEAIKIYEHAV